MLLFLPDVTCSAHKRQFPVTVVIISYAGLPTCSPFNKLSPKNRFPSHALVDEMVF